MIEDGGYDMHECNCVGEKLTAIDATLRAFRTEMINQGIWNNVVIVTGSDFGRVSLWGCDYGEGVSGGAAF